MLYILLYIRRLQKWIPPSCSTEDAAMGNVCTLRWKVWSNIPHQREYSFSQSIFLKFPERLQNFALISKVCEQLHNAFQSQCPRMWYWLQVAVHRVYTCHKIKHSYSKSSIRFKKRAHFHSRIFPIPPPPPFQLNYFCTYYKSRESYVIIRLRLYHTKHEIFSLLEIMLLQNWRDILLQKSTIYRAILIISPR